MKQDVGGIKDDLIIYFEWVCECKLTPYVYTILRVDYGLGSHLYAQEEGSKNIYEGNHCGPPPDNIDNVLHLPALDQ